MSAFARHVEACGFESIVAVEHTVLMTEYSSVYPYDASGRVELPADCPVPDPLDLLAFVAAQTDRLGLATGVLVLPDQHPVGLAQRGASGGARWRRCGGAGFGSGWEWAGSRRRSRRAALSSPAAGAERTNKSR